MNLRVRSLTHREDAQDHLQSAFVNYQERPDGRPFQALRRHIRLECYSLDEYRRGYAQYKTASDLQAAHAAVPWIVTSDQDGTPPSAKTRTSRP